MTAAFWPPRQHDDSGRFYPPEWTESALCAQVGGDVFFPEKGEPSEPAKRVCRSCEVRAECLEYAIEHNIRWGVWGGFSEPERRRLARLHAAGVSAADLIAADDERYHQRLERSAQRQRAYERGRRAAARAAARAALEAASVTSQPVPQPERHVA